MSEQPVYNNVTIEPPADPYADVPPPDEPPAGDRQNDGPTTWEPVDLGPYLRGEVQRPEPSIGIARTDGLRLIYPGREHAVIGATECGKSWLALASVAAELDFGQRVVYMHFEESDPGSTIERLKLLGVDPAAMTERLCFVGPGRPVRVEWLAPLLDIAPSLVVLDGANEATSLHGGGTTKVEDWSDVRRRIITPFVRTGAAVLVCDHIPMGADATRLDSYGTVHKGAVVDGSRIMLENKEPMGRKMRGVSHVYITKDRPGHLRAHGKPSKAPGKTFMGTLIVDDSQTLGPDFTLKFFAPKESDDDTGPDNATDPLMEALHTAVASRGSVPSKSQIIAAAQNDGHKFRRSEAFDAISRLLDLGRLVEVRDGTKKSIQAAQNGSQDPGSEPVPENGSGSGSPKGREPGTVTSSQFPEPAGTGGNRSVENNDQETNK